MIFPAAFTSLAELRDRELLVGRLQKVGDLLRAVAHPVGLAATAVDVGDAGRIAHCRPTRTVRSGSPRSRPAGRRSVRRVVDNDLDPGLLGLRLNDLLRQLAEPVARGRRVLDRTRGLRYTRRSRRHPSCSPRRGHSTFTALVRTGRSGAGTASGCSVGEVLQRLKIRLQRAEEAAS